MSAQKFRVYLTGVVSTTVTVEMETNGLDPDEVKSAAVEAAHEQNQAGLCHHCARHMEAPGEWHAGGWTMGPEDPTEYVEPAE